MLYDHKHQKDRFPDERWTRLQSSDQKSNLRLLSLPTRPPQITNIILKENTKEKKKRRDLNSKNTGQGQPQKSPGLRKSEQDRSKTGQWLGHSCPAPCTDTPGGKHAPKQNTAALNNRCCHSRGQASQHAHSGCWWRRVMRRKASKTCGDTWEVTGFLPGSRNSLLNHRQKLRKLKTPLKVDFAGLRLSLVRITCTFVMNRV